MFCGSTENLKREHVIPVWVTKKIKGLRLEAGSEFLFNDVDRAKFLFNEQRIKDESISDVLNEKVIQQKRPRDDWKARNVCEVCNNGWMSKLEDKAKDYLGHYIASIKNKRVKFTQSQAYYVSLWATKTILITSLQSDSPNSDTTYFPQEFYEAALNQRILPGTVVEYMLTSKVRFDVGFGGDVLFLNYHSDLDKKILDISRYIFKWGFFRFGRLLFRISYLPPHIPLTRVQQEFPFEVVHPHNAVIPFQSYPESRVVLNGEVPRTHESFFLARSFSLAVSDFR
jgi:hypothetical protein